MRHKRKSIFARWLVPAVILLAGNNLLAQGGSQLSLQQCIEYGLSHNTSIMKSNLEVDRAGWRITEGVSTYLPQVTASGQLLDNLKLQTSLIPGEFIGAPGTKVPVQFGTRYNLTGAIDATQKIYDQSLISGIKMAKVGEEVAELTAEKSQQQLTYDIANAYYSAQITYTKLGLVQANLKRVDTLLEVTTLQYNNGFAKKVDVDRLVVNQTNLKTDFETSMANYQQQLLILKYYMGMPLDQPIDLPVITVSDKVNSGLVTSQETTNNVDLQLLQTQNQLNALNLKQLKAGYLPSLSLVFHGAAMFQQNNLRIFEKNAAWYPNSYVGLNLNIPIFDGLAKHARISQMKITIQQNEFDQQYLNESIKMQVANTQSKIRVNLAAIESQQRNIDLAQEVFETTKVQYTNGLVSLTDMVNAENDLRTAQTNYLTALVQVRVSELDLIKITGNYNTIK